MAIDVVNRQRQAPIKRAAIAELAENVLAAAGFEGSSGITVALVGEAEIRRLNRAHRKMDKATDVLSFPADPGYQLGSDRASATYLGDVAVCVDVAKRQALESKLSLEREIAELVIHGVLHLCGYDHEADHGEMNELELKLRKRLLDRGNLAIARCSSS